ncbi:3-methylmercaptopropionyl-CoA dehydrogenase [Nocardia cerradoensis]|uniref:Broad-specificity linear acyl-CoA dehydrogenase FadE5 n=1 Tax=Nocardia cerradoensis TaxID=85688 RepID=A0A231H9U3_9NOCA|nr:acyl-CoA dehydrogenase [Nocardia cerradoensis]OXR45628.1 3-methylmercaptopropionyl-CoA dehydrogenase [Nocardia cerradoensis]
MGHYRSNIRDLEFNLFEVLGLDRVLDSGAFGDLDADTVRAMLAEAARLAEGPVAESFADADRTPPTFDAAAHAVSLPASFVQSTLAWRDAGWHKVGLKPEVGGTPAPAAVKWAIWELLLGAQPAAFVYTSGPQNAAILHDLGNLTQRRWAELAAEREWSGTMALTEADAGSDVGAARTTAIPQADGSWHLEGVKRFITGGDSDISDNILHLVLARPQGAAAGTKGLSLFVVPKFHFDSGTGELGARNGVFVTGLEAKMGLKASATCELTFGGHGIPAVGWLVGDSHTGIAQMFKVIEYARMMVGTKAIATLSSGYLNALAYATTRVQGSDLTRMTDKDAPRVPITHHPDVRRSLLLQKAYTEGLRALYLYAAAHQDPESAAAVSGADAESALHLNHLLLPVVKGVGSERAYQCLTESLQTLGGSGFLQDYPIEQYVRDTKIDSIYEGTTAIQAQDFIFRKILRDEGVAFDHVTGQIAKFLADGPGRLDLERSLLATALADVEDMVETLTGYAAAAQREPAAVYRIGLVSVRFLLAVGDLLVGWLLLRQAEVALAAIDATGSTPFYEGKVAAASFFAKNVLPGLGEVRTIVRDVDPDVMTLDESIF